MSYLKQGRGMSGEERVKSTRSPQVFYKKILCALCASVVNNLFNGEE